MIHTSSSYSFILHSTAYYYMSKCFYEKRTLKRTFRDVSFAVQWSTSPCVEVERPSYKVGFDVYTVKTSVLFSTYYYPLQKRKYTSPISIQGYESWFVPVQKKQSKQAKKVFRTKQWFHKPMCTKPGQIFPRKIWPGLTWTVLEVSFLLISLRSFEKLKKALFKPTKKNCQMEESPTTNTTRKKILFFICCNYYMIHSEALRWCVLYILFLIYSRWWSETSYRNNDKK